MQVAATDADLGANGEVRFSIAGGVNSNAFSIDEITGQISTALATCAATHDQYTLIVNASDRGQPPRTTSTTVNVSVAAANRATPVFQQPSYTVSVRESAPPSSLLTVSATDADCAPDTAITYVVSPILLVSPKV